MSSADLLKKANTGAESADARHLVASGRRRKLKAREPFEDNARVMLLIFAGATTGPVSYTRVSVKVANKDE